MRRVIIAGTHSGCGKTTVTCAILQALCSRKMKVSSFKCGPDYIDPMFHERIIGTPAYNLDSFFCNDDTLKYLLCENSVNSDISVIEGVMGFYDGADEKGSAYSLARITDSPVVMVVDCKGMSGSIGAVMKGFLEYKKPNNIIGFVFNRLPERLAPMAEKMCRDLETEYLGFFPQNDVNIKSRRLGLVTADEVSGLRDKMQRLGVLAEKNIKIDRIIELSQRRSPQFTLPELPKNSFSERPVIAVARDGAFCFIYNDNIMLLEKLGCGIKYFSPLYDRRLPEADGLILPGGYPELYAHGLSQNGSMMSDIRRAVAGGMPAIAECGGFMYLHDEMEDDSGEIYKMAGVIRGKAFRTDRLKRFGYVVMTARHDNMLCEKGGSFPAHEFHYWDSTSCGGDFAARKPDGREWSCVHAGDNMYAGFPHLYFWGNINIAVKFVEKCAEYGGKYAQDT